MKIELNLATQPFGHRRLFWVASGVSAFLLAAVAMFLIVIYAQEHELSPELVTREARLRSRLAALTAEESELRNTLQDPVNNAVLERSLFLNQLLYRKGISWTRTFADLEKVLPARVQVIQIRPAVTATNSVRLDMQVGAETPADFIDLLKTLEASELFGSPYLRGSAPPTENQPLYRYQLSVSYDQEL